MEFKVLMKKRLVILKTLIIKLKFSIIDMKEIIMCGLDIIRFFFVYLFFVRY